MSKPHQGVWLSPQKSLPRGAASGRPCPRRLSKRRAAHPSPDLPPPSRTHRQSPDQQAAVQVLSSVSVPEEARTRVAHTHHLQSQCRSGLTALEAPAPTHALSSRLQTAQPGPLGTCSVQTLQAPAGPPRDRDPGTCRGNASPQKDPQQRRGDTQSFPVLLLTPFFV